MDSRKFSTLDRSRRSVIEEEYYHSVPTKRVIVVFTVALSVIKFTGYFACRGFRENQPLPRFDRGSSGFKPDNIIKRDKFVIQQCRTVTITKQSRNSAHNLAHCESQDLFSIISCLSSFAWTFAEAGNSSMKLVWRHKVSELAVKYVSILAESEGG